MASPKASREDQTQALFTKLAPLIKGQQHKKAVRTIDSSKVFAQANRPVSQPTRCTTQSCLLVVLKLQPTDEDAIKCKVAVLLEGQNFQEALDYINSLQDNVFHFEQVSARKVTQTA